MDNKRDRFPNRNLCLKPLWSKSICVRLSEFALARVTKAVHERARLLGLKETLAVP